MTNNTLSAPEAAPVAPAPQPVAFDNVELPDVDDMAHSALQEALSFGLDHNVIARFGKSVMQKTQAAMLAAAPKAAPKSFKPLFDKMVTAAGYEPLRADVLAGGNGAPLQQGEYLPLPSIGALKAVMQDYRWSDSPETLVAAHKAIDRDIGALLRAAIDADRAARGAAQAAPAHIAAMERAWLWMENQSDAQSKGGHATFDLMMLRDERDALREAIDTTPEAEDAGIGKALHDAATSLETISRIAGKDQYMLEMMDVRLYAAARAKAAREVQAAQAEGGAKP